MAPDRGDDAAADRIDAGGSAEAPDRPDLQMKQSEQRRFIQLHAAEGQNFTLRGILVGLGVGTLITFSNMYFGLQTGWISGMAMPSALIGFAFFKSLSKHLNLPFTPVENVLVQTVAGSMGTMPLGCGFVGVVPALNFMMMKKENGPIDLSIWQLMTWALGLCFFGVVFAVPLRRQVIIREKLKFPSGTATALIIGVLHGQDCSTDSPLRRTSTDADVDGGRDDIEGSTSVSSSDWRAKIKLLLASFAASGFYTLLAYFFPFLRKIPIFGTYLAREWLWTLNPSLGYVGQGIIMGPTVTTHMLLGAVLGWAVLSPVAKHHGWAPGPISDWETGSKGWIVWVSLAIMLADAIINLGYIAARPAFRHGLYAYNVVRNVLRDSNWMHLRSNWRDSEASNGSRTSGYTLVHSDGAAEGSESSGITTAHKVSDLEEPDAPLEHQVNSSTFWIGLLLSVALCISTVHIVFGNLVPIYASITSVLVALVLSVMGVRAMGETDLNPVSGISKLAQLFFAVIISSKNKNAVLINLIAGAISESGALQAGDLMQDLKAGHLLGAAPNAQFWGQIIGSGAGAIVSAMIYKLYINVYEIPGEQFQIPTGYVWIFTARLVTGQGLPPMATRWALCAAAVCTLTTGLRIYLAGTKWRRWIPGGIAVAVGMFNVPSFTIARAIGGFVSLYWCRYKGRQETPLVILASGFILGEGVISILRLLLASLKVPHL